MCSVILISARFYIFIFFYWMILANKHFEIQFAQIWTIIGVCGLGTLMNCFHALIVLKF